MLNNKIITGQKIGNEMMLDDGENTIFIEIEEYDWIDYMKCPNCTANWFKVIRTGLNPYDFYHECVKCGHKNYP